MANYLSRFSCLLPLGKPEDVPLAHALYLELAAELLTHEATTPGFTISDAAEAAIPTLLLVSDDAADPEWVISFVLRCAAACDLQGRWGFTWADTCSRPLTDGFGGGAHVIDLSARTSLAWIDASHWLRMELDQVGSDVPAMGSPA